MALSDSADARNSFILYCKQASDAQLANILKKEWEAGRSTDYQQARQVAEQRGWVVVRGERI